MQENVKKRQKASKSAKKWEKVSKNAKKWYFVARGSWIVVRSI